jgi:uncharacterized protein
MKSSKIAGDAGHETRVVILDSGEETFAALTKFANDARLTAASLHAARSTALPSALQAPRLVP